MHMLTLILISAVIGMFTWRTRGGGLANVLNNKLGGTTVIRIFCATVYAAWLYYVLPSKSVGFNLPVWVNFITVLLTIYLGLALDGWGPFQGVNEPSIPGQYPEKSIYAKLPLLLGFPVGSIGYDLIGLAQCGAVAAILVAIDVTFITQKLLVLLFIPLMAIYMPLMYYIANTLRLKPFTKFIDGSTAWAEFFIGGVYLSCLTALIFS